MSFVYIYVNRSQGCFVALSDFMPLLEKRICGVNLLLNCGLTAVHVVSHIRPVFV